MQKGLMRILMVFILTAVVAIDVHAFRCGNEIVTAGDSEAVVLLRCGPPTYKKAVKTETRGTTGGGYYRGHYYGGQYSEETVVVEEWYYNCGENDFIYILTFKAGVLEKETSAGYGSGASDCKGRR
ncbi:MAG: DUF2845 domain-containing protein [Smithellaceae bacterium]|nr:DUF2845 domain-containing protein [Smithellaceae bacterium]